MFKINFDVAIFFNSGGHESFLWGHWYPSFRLLVTSALSFKARVDPLACVSGCMKASSDSYLEEPANLLSTCMAVELLYPLTFTGSV